MSAWRGTVKRSKFGSQAVLWSSDWPVLNLAGDYAQWVRVSDTLLANLSAPERQAVFAGNAQRFYRLGA